MAEVRTPPNTRLNVLLTEDRPHAAEHWTTQLPRLLAPMGVASYVARSGQDAIRMAERVRFHAAVIDLGTPMGRSDMWNRGTMMGATNQEPAQPRPARYGQARHYPMHDSSPKKWGNGQKNGLHAFGGLGGVGAGASSPAGLWMMQLMRRLPSRPAMVVVRAPAYNQRQVERLLGEALRLGAFSVLNKPVDLEQMLTVFRRLIDRQYHGYWPPRQG